MRSHICHQADACVGASSFQIGQCSTAALALQCLERVANAVTAEMATSAAVPASISMGQAVCPETSADCPEVTRLSRVSPPYVQMHENHVLKPDIGRVTQRPLLLGLLRTSQLLVIAAPLLLGWKPHLRGHTRVE